jgi:uronate dehydrogenase
LRTWLSFDDLRQLVSRSVTATTTGFTVVFGISDNDRAPVNNAKAAFLGYKPKDNAENWADSLLTSAPAADPADRAQLCLGGPFATVPLGESGVAQIKAMAPIEPDIPPTNTSPVVSAIDVPAIDPKRLPSFLTKKGMNP